MSSPKVFLVLDFSDAETALKYVLMMKGVNPYFKIGLELFLAAGPAFVQKLVEEEQAEIFLDLKYHDIPNTVAAAVRNSVRLGVKWTNVHCAGGGEMLKAAAEACASEAQKIGRAAPVLLGVTVLTSLEDQALKEIGYDRSAAQQVEKFVVLAESAGLDGVVCSGQEIGLIRKLTSDSFFTMVPGIRPAGASANDQKRVMTPKEAAQAGASALVIGRPITHAVDPVAVMKTILAELVC